MYKNFMDLVHELCSLQLLEVTKKSDILSGWLASIQHLAHMHISKYISICQTSHLLVVSTLFCLLGKRVYAMSNKIYISAKVGKTRQGRQNGKSWWIPDRIEKISEIYYFRKLGTQAAYFLEDKPWPTWCLPISVCGSTTPSRCPRAHCRRWSRTSTGWRPGSTCRGSSCHAASSSGG